MSPYTKDEAAAIIRKHFSLIFEDDDWGCVTFINRANDSAPVVNKVNSTTRFTTDRGIAELFKQNETQDVYVAMNSVEKKKEARRKKECLGDCRNVFMEVDENGDAVLAAVRESVAKNEIPRPSTILQSSPGKYQFIWPVNARTQEHPDGFTMAVLEATNEALVLRFGGDCACSDVLRLFRLPCFRNLKYPQRPVVEVVESERGTSL